MNIHYFFICMYIYVCLAVLVCVRMRVCVRIHIGANRDERRQSLASYDLVMSHINIDRVYIYMYVHVCVCAVVCVCVCVRVCVCLCVNTGKKIDERRQNFASYY